MSEVGVEQFRGYLESVEKFAAKVRKEPIERRTLERFRKLELELQGLERGFSQYKSGYNLRKDKTSFEEVKNYASNISEVLTRVREVLISWSPTQPQVVEVLDRAKMGEKFDLRTAASLLPAMDSTEDSVRQLIDAIELYDSFLDTEGKSQLVIYILKVKLSLNAKIRLEKTYGSVQSLVRDMRKHLLTEKSAATLAVELHKARQNNRSVENFGKDIEQLMLELTLSQSKGDDRAQVVLQGVNEDLAINAFCNGLKDGNLRTVIRSRGYGTLKDTIAGAKDEERNSLFVSPTNNVFHARGQHFSRGSQGHSYFRGHGRQNASSGNFSFGQGTRSSNQQNYFRVNNSRGRRQIHGRTPLNRRPSRVNNNNNNIVNRSSSHRAYITEGQGAVSTGNSDSSRFFRVPRAEY